MRAMILAAGYGTRLWPLTLDRAKAAVPFLNRPLISFSIEYLYRFGIREVIINLHHQPETVRAAVEQCTPPDMRIHFSLEADILGTGGALDRVRSLLQEAAFIVINGKIITEIDLAAVLETHRRRSALATLVLRPNTDREPFSRVEIDAAGRIVRFSGCPPAVEADPAAQEQESPLMFTGIQILEPGIFRYIPRGRFSHTTTEAYPHAIDHGEIIAAHIDTGAWHELSTLGRYLNAHLTFLQRQGESVICGRQTMIDTTARVRESVLWDHVQVMAGASLRRCIVGDGVIIPAGAGFERAAIVRAELCPQPDRGEMRGENLVVPF